MCSGLMSSRCRQARHQRGRILAHHRCGRDHAVVFDLQQLHRGHVHDELQARDRVRVGVRLGCVADPDVAPAEAPVPELLRHELAPVGPDVDQGERHVSDSASSQRRDHVGVGLQRVVALVPLVDGEVGLHPGHVVEGQHRVGAEVDDRFVGAVRRPVPEHSLGLTRQGVALRPRQHVGLRWLQQLDRGDPEGVRHAGVAPQRGHHRSELVGGQRVERMRSHQSSKIRAGVSFRSVSPRK